jgi:6,7-dimethyl-8-ribityllumazine synthase
MAGAESRPLAVTIPGTLGLRVGVVRARWNEPIVERLAAGVERAIEAHRAVSVGVTVPGAFELPFGARALIVAGAVDAVVVIGAVIRGETTHYELVSEGCAQGVQQVQLMTGVPVGMGVLTVEDQAQAYARSEGPGGHNVGEEAAAAALEMAVLARELGTSPGS